MRRRRCAHRATRAADDISARLGHGSVFAFLGGGGAAVGVVSVRTVGFTAPAAGRIRAVIR